MKFVSLIFLSLTLVACQSSQNRGPNAITADYVFEDGYKQVTFLGENDQPRFSETGNELIFISRQRNSHLGTQVYEIDLRKNRERRVTFHDGDASCPSYINGRKIIYCSTTDEIKETPYLNRNIDPAFPPSELYMSDVYGGDIERLTNHPGFDNEAIYAKGHKPLIIYTSTHDGVTGIYSFSIKTGIASVLISEKGKLNSHPTLSSDRKKMAWVEKDLKTNHESIKMMTIFSKKTETIKDNGGKYQDLFWQVDSSKIFYSVLRTGDKWNQLEVYDLGKKCTQGLFKAKDSLFQPVVSNEVKPKLAFTRAFQGKRQIYMVALPSDLGPCFEETTSSKIEK